MLTVSASLAASLAASLSGSLSAAPTAMTASGATALAHGIHYAIVGGGVVGLLLLLAPRLVPGSSSPRDPHEARVLALRQALATPLDPTRSDALSSVLTASRVQFSEPVLGVVARVLLPLAVISSVAAAGVHAALGPAHLREQALFGAFFAGCALAQVVWAAAMTLRPSYALLAAGAFGNIGVLVLWAVTRTVGLPFGLLPQPEAVGAWDLTCGAWELLTACCCLAVLRRAEPLPSRLVEAWRWHPGVRVFALASVMGLVALSLSGASG